MKFWLLPPSEPDPAATPSKVTKIVKFWLLPPSEPDPAATLRVSMVFLVFDTHHANNILTDSPEHGDHHGTLGMHRACIKHELPTSKGMTFFHTLRAQAQRVHHKADSRRGEAARGRFRARSNGNRLHLTARHIFSCSCLDQIACRRATCNSGGGNRGARALRQARRGRASRPTKTSAGASLRCAPRVGHVSHYTK